MAAGTERLEVLSDEEASELLQRQGFVGRLGFMTDGVMHIVPVNYLAEAPESIVFCTAAGTKLDAVAEGADVVFEVDSSRPFTQSGWSVVARGRTHEIADPEELERLRRGPLRSWAVSPSEHWVRIAIADISGRRIPPH